MQCLKQQITVSQICASQGCICAAANTPFNNRTSTSKYSQEPCLAGLAQRKADPVGLWQQQQQGASKTNSLAADLESIAQSGTTFTTSQGAAAGKLPSTAGAAASATLGLLGAALLTKPSFPPYFCVSTSCAATCLVRAQLLACCQTQMLPSCQALPTWLPLPS